MPFEAQADLDAASSCLQDFGVIRPTNYRHLGDEALIPPRTGAMGTAHPNVSGTNRPHAPESALRSPRKCRRSEHSSSWAHSAAGDSYPSVGDLSSAREPL